MEFTAVNPSGCTFQDVDNCRPRKFWVYSIHWVDALFIATIIIDFGVSVVSRSCGRLIAWIDQA